MREVKIKVIRNKKSTESEIVKVGLSGIALAVCLHCLHPYGCEQLPASDDVGRLSSTTETWNFSNYHGASTRALSIQ